MKVLSLDLILSCDHNTIKQPKLRDVEQNLEPVEFSILDGVAAQIDLCEERKVFNIGQLTSLADVVKLHF